jgi:phage baseplate assembly protein W
MSDPEIYSDLSYNPGLNQLGDVTKLTNMDAIKQSVKTIVLTPLGSRLFEPDFGCGVKQYLFEFLDEATLNNIKAVITNAITKYEPRVKVDSVDVKAFPETNEMSIDITYLISELQEYDTTKIALYKL